jgi:hypothetical protein
MNRDLELIEAGYKALAKKHHPDAGGSDKAMTEVNESRARCKRGLRLLEEAEKQKAEGRKQNADREPAIRVPARRSISIDELVDDFVHVAAEGLAEGLKQRLKKPRR